ncbi:MAG: Hsp20/alpha crystallin family protein [Calditrichaeota bacterium]|nr:Hsp20/alpha crystallin family protein [Calditrichota bacterium]
MVDQVTVKNTSADVTGVEEVKKITYRPATDIYEMADRFVLLLEMPNVKRESLKVYVKDGQLHIEGEKRGYSHGEKFLLRESKDVRYERVFELGEDIDTDSISARYNQGILEISLMKKAGEQIKEIRIQ